jgi:predicted butyrate kinase (DUF1464 family)
MRVAGADPGTSSLDLVILDDGTVADQVRFDSGSDPAAPVQWLRERGQFDLIAGPSGYGLPLVRAADCTETHLVLMSLVRSDERGTRQGIAGFSALARSFRDSGLPVVFLPGVIHLPTVPAHRKFNRIDLGTPDKLCVAALALAALTDVPKRFAVVEFGSAFTACLVVADGQVRDGVGGTGGPVGWKSGGAWDGELAYLLSPLAKSELFRGGVLDAGRGDDALPWLLESVAGTLAALRVTTPFADVILSGAMLQDIGARLHDGLAALLPEMRFHELPTLSGAWVKQAAQGAAIVADGLAGGRFAPLVERLRLRAAAGTVLDWIVHPRGEELRTQFLG